jgi:flagellar hook assembly protein FlgD
VTAVAEHATPGLVHFYPSQPNPPSPNTTLRFDLTEPMPVRLEIFSAGGRRVRVLVDGPLTAGSHQLLWDGTNGDGQRVGTGVYFCLLRAGHETATQSVVVTQ